MPAYYPVYLDLNGRPCVVVGGAHEAERKVQGLLEHGARVTLISPEVSIVLQDLAGRGLIEWKRREYRQGDLEGAFLVVSENLNEDEYTRVAQEAHSLGVLLNVVDRPELCSFIAPAIARRGQHGEVQCAISTAGLSPALARRLREMMSDPDLCLCLQWADMVDVLADVRTEVRGKGLRPDPERWQECMDDELLAMFQSGQVSQARERLRRMLEEQPHASQGAGA